MATNRKENLRFRYGRCLNDECENCKSKKVIEIPSRKDFVCPDCGKELLECAPPKKKSNSILIGIIAGIIILMGTVVAFIFCSGNDSAEDEISNSSQEIVTESEQAIIAVESEIEEEIITTEEAQAAELVTPVSESKTSSVNAPAQTSPRNKDLGYATWKGGLKNGQPNDENGTMTFKESHRIDSRDSQARVAEPGDYIIGEYVDGKLVQGIWYDKANTVKGSIIIGR